MTTTEIDNRPTAAIGRTEETAVPDHRYTGPDHRGPKAARQTTPTADAAIDEALTKAVKHAGIMRQGFYLVVLVVAAAGQVSGLMESFNLSMMLAIPAVAALELGGVVVMANADVRRRLGERAIASRLLSAGIALGAVAFNWLAHADHLLGGFFAGMSLLGYLVWLMHTENQRRDRLRAKGDLPPTTPAYEIVGHWLRHPWITARARSLAKANPQLGLYESLDAARAEITEERRLRAMGKIVGRRMRRTAPSKDHAALAVAAFPLDQVAVKVAARADLDALADDIATEMTPSAEAAGRRPRWAAVLPWPWLNRLDTALAAQATEHRRTLAAANARHAETITMLEADLRAQIAAEAARADAQTGDAQTRADRLAQTLDEVRAEHAQVLADLRAQAARDLATQIAQTRTQVAAQTEERLRAQIRAETTAEFEARYAHLRTQETDNTDPARHQRKPAKVTTLHADTEIVDKLWDAYAAQMRADGTPLSRYRVEQMSGCKSTQAQRVLTQLAQKWTAQTTQNPAQTGAQGSEPAHADDRADPEERAS